MRAVDPQLPGELVESGRCSPAAATRDLPILGRSADTKNSHLYAAATIPNASQNAGFTTNFAIAPCRCARVVKILES